MTISTISFAVKFLTELRHPNILLLHETFQYKNNIFLVLEVMNTDLEIVIRAKQVPLPVVDIEHYMYEMFNGKQYNKRTHTLFLYCSLHDLSNNLSGVAFLHKNWILHRVSFLLGQT